MNPEELELAYYRRIMVAMVTQAVDDLTNDRQPATDRTRMMLEQNYESALTFVRSRAFELSVMLSTFPLAGLEGDA
jgi:hypothetical protein